ncbi:MAG TPA: right-handed parallel beta-helix repeat-containing protein, partial [Planctomycetota bacterium]|nr:right-handed parallel beta-helix repeat-containing protein [Planctomycetota bacterium]
DMHEFFVSARGNDGWSGRLPKAINGTAGPFATLVRARNAIREMRGTTGLPEGGITVTVLPGDYILKDSFSLTEEDSGTPESPIIYRAAAGGAVRLVGGRVVRGFTGATYPATARRLAPSARGNVLQVKLLDIGILDMGRLHSRGFGRQACPAHLELFFDGKPMTVARWPNDDFVKIAGFPKDAAAKDDFGGDQGKLGGGFFYEGDRPRRWKSTENVWVHGYWSYDWANTYEAVDSIDLDSRLLKTKPPFGQYGFRTGQRFCFLNVLEELDQPGEYYVDAKEGVLYFWPPQPLDGHEVLASVLETPAVEMRNASFISLQGFTVQATRGTGIKVSGGANCSIGRCTLTGIGMHGIEIAGGTGHTVSGCEISETGDSGIEVTGGNRKTLTPSGHVVHNNHVHHFARWSRCYRPAVHAMGVGTKITHNLIHDAPHSGIIYWGNEFLIEFNEIHHVTLETGDCGAIYTGRDYTARGNIIRHNYIHDTGGFGMGSMAVYLDDCVSGQTVVGNLFVRVTRAVMIGGGRDIRVENNVFVDCKPAIWFDGRGLDKSPVWHNMVYNTMKQRLDDVNYHQPPYSERYPELLQLDAYYAKDDGIPPENNVVARNICFGGTWIEATWHKVEHYLKLEQNIVSIDAKNLDAASRQSQHRARVNQAGVDPRFLDPSHDNYALRPESPAWKIGFQPIPVEKIGLVKGE